MYSISISGAWGNKKLTFLNQIVIYEFYGMKSILLVIIKQMAGIFNVLIHLETTFSKIWNLGMTRDDKKLKL